MGSPWKRHERETAEAIRKAGLDPDADRFGAGRQNQRGGGRDIVTPNLPWCIECSTNASQMPDIAKKVGEAVEDAGPGEYPIAAIERRRGRGIPRDRLVVLREEDFLELMQLIDW